MSGIFTPTETSNSRAVRISKFVATQIARYRNSQTGNASIVFSLALIPLLACAGVAIDYLRADRTAVELQGFADAAALAAASAQNVTGTTTQKIAKRKAIALEYLENSPAAMEDVVLKEPPVISVTNNTVDVSLKAVVAGSLVNVLSVSKDGADFSDAPDGGDYGGSGAKKINVGAHSKVAWSRDSYLCLLALNPHKTESIYFQGNSEFMAEVCAVQANSDATIAMRT